MSKRKGKKHISAGGGIGGVSRERSLEDYTPHLVYLRSHHDRERAEAMGVEAMRTGEVTSIRPVMSRADYSDMMFNSKPAATGHEDLMHPFVVPGTEAWNKFMSTRKVVETVEPSGRKMAAVVSNIYDKLQVRDDASGVKKVFRLTQVLTDPHVQAKYGLDAVKLRALRALAIARPDEAASRAARLMREVRPDLQIMVSAEGHSRTRAAAKEAVADFCGRFPRVSATEECTVIGDDIFMHAPGDKDLWFVSGPLTLATEVALIHRAVEACGGPAVMFSLGSELVTLRVDIALRQRYLCPDMEYHVGDGTSTLPAGSSPLTSEVLSVEGRARMMAMRPAVAEVTVDGRLVASCVRVSDKYYVLGSHVLDGSDLMVDGRPLRALRTVAPDLWLVEASGPGVPAWPMREAQEGERVVVCYRGPTGDLQYTSPMSVLSAGQFTLTLSITDELCKGMSGGAVVALEDQALLGIYEGTGKQQAAALVFSPSMFADVHSVSGYTEESRADALQVIQHLRDQGLGARVDAALAAATPLYSNGHHVGHAFGVGATCYTTCNPDEMTLSLEPGGAPLVFSKHGFLYAAGRRLPPQPVVTRPPGYYEKVVVVGRDAEGPYVSSTTRVVHVGVGASNFSLELLDGDTELTYDGGLVVSLKDGAILGTRVRQSVTVGAGAVEFCVAVPRAGLEAGSEKYKWAEALKRVFPVLRPEIWTEGVLEEVFKHESVREYKTSGKVMNAGSAPLAFIGDACLKTRYAQLARQFGLPFRKWPAELALRLSDASLSALAKRVDLGAGMQFGEGFDRSMVDDAVLAGLARAVVGAAKTCEIEPVFEQFADLLLHQLGATVVLPLRSPVLERASLVE